jgi:hypothetical protein
MKAMHYSVYFASKRPQIASVYSHLQFLAPCSGGRCTNVQRFLGIAYMSTVQPEHVQYRCIARDCTCEIIRSGLVPFRQTNHFSRPVYFTIYSYTACSGRRKIHRFIRRVYNRRYKRTSRISVHTIVDLELVVSNSSH